MFREKGMGDLGRKVSSWNFQSVSAAVTEEGWAWVSGGREKMKSGRKESQLQTVLSVGSPDGSGLVPGALHCPGEAPALL